MFKIISSNEYRSLKSRIAILSEKLEEKKKMIEDLKEAIKLTNEKHDKEVSELKLDNKDLKQRLKHKEELHAEQEQNLISQCDNLKKNYEDVIAQNASEYARVTKELSEVTEKANNLQKELDQKEIITYELHKKNEKLEERLNFYKKPTLEELKTEKMNKVDRSKLRGKKNA